MLRHLTAALLVAASIAGAGAVAPAAATAAPLPVAPPAGSEAPIDLVAGKGTTDASEVELTPQAPTPTGRADGPPAAGATGWSTTVELLPGTQMVALSWDGATSAPDGAVAVRARSGEAVGDWSTHAPEPDDGGDEGVGRVGSDVIWLGHDGADAVEVRVEVGPLVGLELLRMRYHEGEPVPATAAPEGRALDGRAARPTIRPREEWATAGWASWNSGCGAGPSVASRLDHAVVHHTASTNDYSAAQVPGLIDGIRRYHTASLGWCDIAYSFVVDRFGTIWQGRAGDVTQPVVGGHAKGFNTGSVGVTLLGQFEPGASPAAAQPTTAMMDGLARILAWKLGLHGLDPRGTTTVTSGGSTRYAAGVAVTLPIINAHRDSSLTACPGANVISRMAALRDAVAALSSSTPPPPVEPPPPTQSWDPFATVEDLVWRQYADVLRQPGTYTSRRWWHVALADGSTNRNALVASLVRSDEGQARTAAMVRLYLAYFRRIPDHAGIRYWWGQYDRGQGVRTMSQAFTFTPEFKRQYGALSNGDFVRLVYQNVLGRSPDAAGYAYWKGQLDGGRQNRGTVMVQFSESAENRTRSRDVVEVIVVHEVMLGRAISATSHLQWVAKVQSQGIGALIGNIFSSTEYAVRVGG